VKERTRRLWGRIGRVAMVAFLVAVVVLLVRYARSIDWKRVVEALGDYGADELLTAASLATVSYLLYCSYDLTARRYTHHLLPTPRVMAIAFVSYAMSLNLGALIGGGGFRLRLYSHAGLAPSRIARVAAFSVFTNWLGYAVLAGVVLVGGWIVMPAGWPVAPVAMQGIGALLLAAAAAYLVACATLHERHLRIRSHVFSLPTLPIALLQTALACCNWLVIAGIPYVLLHGEVAFPVVLGVLLLSGIAAAMVHVPAGLGVLEAVFIALLESQVPRFGILAALLAYRAVYYLAPLSLALPLYFWLEAHHRLGGAKGVARSGDPP
jgi:uncharacterized membrane protein YbhN (UPF0104 family)